MICRNLLCKCRASPREEFALDVVYLYSLLLDCFTINRRASDGDKISFENIEPLNSLKTFSNYFFAGSVESAYSKKSICESTMEGKGPTVSIRVSIIIQYAGIG